MKIRCYTCVIYVAIQVLYMCYICVNLDYSEVTTKAVNVFKSGAMANDYRDMGQLLVM